MARIVISSHGTTGDFVPFIPLAKRLKHRGHDVLVAVNPAMQALFRNAGLSVIDCGAPFGPEEAQRFARVFDGWADVPDREQLDEQINDVPTNYKALREVCRGADLLVACSIQYAAWKVSETLDLPWVCVYCNAGLFPHEPEDPFLLLPWADLHLVASSAHFSQPRPDARYGDRPPRLTGFWHYAGEDQPGWTEPEPALKTFVASGEPPLVLLPGSIPVTDAGAVVAVHAEAAVRLGRRLVIQEGWAGLVDKHLPAVVDRSQVYFARSLPHDWLLERSAALITHGTMGIVSKALRAACPMLVEPYGRDLFFNARRIKALGLGTAMNPHQLTAATVARVLEERVLPAAVKRRAEEVATAVRAEDGVEVACELIDEVLDRRSDKRGVPAALRSDRTVVLLFNRRFDNNPPVRAELLPEGCELTTDRRRLREAAAVVFHLPRTPDFTGIEKLPGQKWVALSMECEVHDPRLSDPAFLRQFHLTMTYRRDSDAPMLYCGPGMAKTLRTPPRPKSRNRLAVLFMSSGFDQSGRGEYAAELMRHLDVHSYGRSLNNRTLLADAGRATKHELIAGYKFTLAFENALALDYVTEKFFDPLEAGSVPVYLGAPNIDVFAPGEHCYLRTADFGSPRELAEELRRLNEDDAAYGAYLEWKLKPFRPDFLRMLEEMRENPYVRLFRKLRAP